MNMPRSRVVRLLAWTAAIVTPNGLCAQDVVVPSGFAAIDAPGVGDLPGLMQTFRQQVVIAASELPGVAGQELVAIAVRREGRDQRAFAGGLARLLVRVSESLLDPRDAQPVFASNQGATPGVAFQGEVLIPSSPALTQRNGARWTAPDAVVITLAQPFRYRGGNLCLEFEGEPVPGASAAWWPIDAYTASGTGVVTRIGTSCAPSLSASAAGASLTPGCTLRLIGSGQAGSAGFFLLGAVRLTSPFDLAFLGAPGCLVHTVPEVSLPTPFSTPPHADMPGDAGVELHIPNQGGLLGSELIAQWLNLQRVPTNAAGLATSNALGLRLSPTMPTLPVASIRSGLVAPGSPLPPQGRVLQGRTPVLRLSFR